MSETNSEASFPKIFFGFGKSLLLQTNRNSKVFKITRRNSSKTNVKKLRHRMQSEFQKKGQFVCGKSLEILK